MSDESCEGLEWLRCESKALYDYWMPAAKNEERLKLLAQAEAKRYRPALEHVRDLVINKGCERRTGHQVCYSDCAECVIGTINTALNTGKEGREMRRERDNFHNNGCCVSCNDDGPACSRCEDLEDCPRGLRAVLGETRKALEAFLECPTTLDPATVPKCGVEQAPPYQVVVNFSCAYTKIINARKILRSFMEATPCQP
jgi:hypothetical protein